MSQNAPPPEDSEPSTGERQWDPSFISARREAIVICSIFALLLTWAISISYFDGYHYGSVKIPTLLGMPRWIVLGVFVPWIIANAITYWFCFFYMKDDSLLEPEDEEDLNDQDEDSLPESTSENG